jgi:uncharacterized protein YbcI
MLSVRRHCSALRSVGSMSVATDPKGCRMSQIAKKTPSIVASKEEPTDEAIAGDGPLAKLHRDGRKSRRFVVPPARQSCELKVGGKVLSALLVDESQGGFGVWADRLEGLKAGENVKLRTDKGWFTVRVVYVKEIVKSQDTKLHLGLKKANGFFCFLGRRTRLEKGAGRTVAAETTEKSPLRTKKQIEAVISEEMSRFEQDYMGQGPREVSAYLLGNLLVVRLRSVLAEAKQQLATLLPGEKGRSLLKEVRNRLIETTHPVIEVMVERVIGVKVVSMQHDINATTGEEVIVFTLATSPDCLK